MSNRSYPIGAGDPDAFVGISESLGVDLDKLHEATAGMEPLDPIRGRMAGVEMFRSIGSDFLDPWVAAILATYEEAFGTPHPAVKGK